MGKKNRRINNRRFIALENDQNTHGQAKEADYPPIKTVQGHAITDEEKAEIFADSLERQCNEHPTNNEDNEREVEQQVGRLRATAIINGQNVATT